MKARLLQRTERRRSVVGAASHHREFRERLQHQPHQHRHRLGRGRPHRAVRPSKPTSSHIIGDHAYAVVGYNASSSKPLRCSTRGAPQSSGWAPGTNNTSMACSGRTHAFISHNFDEQSVGTGAINVNDIDGAIEELTESAALGKGSTRRG